MSCEGSSSNLIKSFTTSPDKQAALQFAFFNTLLFVLTGICLCGLFALYKMMYMFLSPLMWAVLVGTVLFPLKKSVTIIVKEWLDELQKTNTTLTVGLLIMPLSTFKTFSEKVYNTAMSATGLQILSAYFTLKLLKYDRTFPYIIACIWHVYRLTDGFIEFYSATWVFPLMLVYFCAYASWIYVQQGTTINKKVARTFSAPLWVYALSFVSYYFGVFKAAVFGVLAVVLILLSAGAWIPEVQETDADGEVENVGESGSHKINGVTAAVSIDKALCCDSLILMIASLCALSWIIRHDWALFLIFIPFMFAAFIRIGASVGFFCSIRTVLISIGNRLYPLVKTIVNVTVSGSFRKFVKMLFTSDQMLVNYLNSNKDVLSSIVVMGLLAFFSIFALLFVGFQLHSETVHIIRITTNIVSSRPDWLGAAMNFTEDKLEDHDINIDKYIEQAYQQGRSWLASNVRSLADPKDAVRADMLETQVMKVVDNLYKMWEDRNNASQDATSNELHGDWKNQLTSVKNLSALKEEVIMIIRENLDTLMGVARSLWKIVSFNLFFIVSLIGAFAGLILDFGMDIINLVIETVVFLTMVYYLLSASRDRWLPIEWISKLANMAYITSSKVNSSAEYDLTNAIEEAISGVFVLSSKMAVFYGLYTYFVHSLFDLNVVFVPCILAAVFAAIPIMPPFIVCILGVFELWLVRGELSVAIGFTLISLAPRLFVDATFYTEVKFSHPYVTGLSIIGGMYWLGLKGAIIGPIILCSFLVLVNVYMQVAGPYGEKIKTT